VAELVYALDLGSSPG